MIYTRVESPVVVLHTVLSERADLLIMLQVTVT